MKLEPHCNNSNTGVNTQFLEKALVTIPITFTLSTISAFARLALTLQSAPVHRGGGQPPNGLGQHFFLSKSLRSVISTLGFECLICSLVTNKRSAPVMLSTQDWKVIGS